MDCASDPRVRKITLMWGAQTGKTDGLINNTIGYYIAQNPRSIMVMHPTMRDLQTWIEAKLTPLINDTPEVNERMAKPRGREGVNNQNMKSYPGGFLMFAYSGSSNTMRGRSAPIILCDEIDGYEATAEGDPVNLLWQRAATFGDQRKLILTSTPTIKGESRIESAYEESDQRRFHLPCIECGATQSLSWSNVKWDRDADGNHLPDTARYVCEHCSYEWTDGDKLWAIQRGQWIADKPFLGHAGFHLSELYSPWRKWRDIVQSFLEKKHGGDLQSFVNVSLAETWEEKGETQDAGELFTRREKYESEVPSGALVLTAGVDVQDNRLELEVYAEGKDAESWAIAYHVLHGDPAQPDVWQSLDEILDKPYLHEDGYETHISAAAIDTGGHHTQMVYKMCKDRPKLHAIKGIGGQGKPIVSRATKNNLGKVDLFPVGVDSAKEAVYRRFRIQETGYGFCHFPEGPNFDEEYFKQLTAETLVTRYVKGQPKREWKKKRPRNEALDCRVYAVAAMAILRPNFDKIETNLQKAAKRANPAPEKKAPIRPSRQRKAKSNFTTGWKR